ncbi:MAG: hypothetical protein DRN07_08310, partial [Thermoplasmata archaeon]
YLTIGRSEFDFSRVLCHNTTDEGLWSEERAFSNAAPSLPRERKPLEFPTTEGFEMRKQSLRPPKSANFKLILRLDAENPAGGS